MPNEPTPAEGTSSAKQEASGGRRPSSCSPSSDTPEKLTLMELLDCLCDAAWSHDNDDRTHYSARLMLFVENIERERRLLAMLAAKTPQFFNPLLAMEAETIRDRILSENAGGMARELAAQDSESTTDSNG